MELNYDILVHIFESIDEAVYYPTLYACSLVNHAFNETASRCLYQKVVLSPPYTDTIAIGRRDQQLNGLFTSARLPRNRQYVLDVQIAGFLEIRSPPINRFPEVLSEALHQWTNLRSFILTPSQYPDALIPAALHALSQCQFLSDLTLGSVRCLELAVPLLSRLESLTIARPSRALLNLLPDWLSRLSPTLTTFRLTNDCGSVTPGVLRSFIPHLSQIRTFALGLSYSLTHDDVFECLQNLPHLQTLELHYYLQLRGISTILHLPYLTSLTISFIPIVGLYEGAHLVKFIRHLSSRSPLEKLFLVDGWSQIPYPTIQGLAEHLSARHSDTLRELHISSLFLRTKAVKKLFTECTRLEKIELVVHDGVLWNLMSLSAPLVALHTVSLICPHTRPRNVKMCAGKVYGLMKRSVRRLTVNKTDRWKGFWCSLDDGATIAFIVQPVFLFKLPWES